MSTAAQRFEFAPPPQRDRSEPPIQAATMALEQAQQALRQVQRPLKHLC